MLKFKTSCAVLAKLSSNLLNEVGLSLFRYFEVGLRVCDIVVNKFTFAISSPDEFLFVHVYCIKQQAVLCKFHAVSKSYYALNTLEGVIYDQHDCRRQITRKKSCVARLQIVKL